MSGKLPETIVVNGITYHKEGSKKRKLEVRLCSSEMEEFVENFNFEDNSLITFTGRVTGYQSSPVDPFPDSRINMRISSLFVDDFKFSGFAKKSGEEIG